MQLITLEIAAMESTVEDANQGQVKELSDLQLAFVGGGIADPVAY